MTRVDDIHQATEYLRQAIDRIGGTMLEKGLPGDTSLLESECTRIAQDTTDTTGMPLAQALRSVADQVDQVHLGIIMGRHQR